MTIASLQSRLDEFKKGCESGAPPYNTPHEAIETMHRATAAFKASGIENTALKVGDRAPEFSLFNQDHVEVNSADLLRQGPIVVSFFRGHLTLGVYTHSEWDENVEAAKLLGERSKRP